MASAVALPAAALTAEPAAIAAATALPPIGDSSRAAGVARARHVVETLSSRFIKAGWHGSTENAPHGSSRTCGHTTKTTAPTRGFKKSSNGHDHGQSLDWLFDGDVGPMICRRASESPIATAIPDPAFDAIEHFQASWKAVGDACDGEPDEKRSPLHAAWAAWDAKQEAVNSAHSDAEWEMVQTIPTTRAGAVAMITAYIEQSDLGEAEQMLLETLAEAIPHLV